MCGLNRICESVSLLNGTIIWIRDNLSYLGLELLNFFFISDSYSGTSKNSDFQNSLDSEDNGRENKKEYSWKSHTVLSDEI